MKCAIALLAVLGVASAHWGAWDGPKWHGPLALPPGYDAHGAPLPVLDTPEVAAEKAVQMAILARAGGSVPAGSWAHLGAWAAAPGHNNPLWNVHALPAAHGHNNPLWNVHALPAGVHG